MTYKTCNNQDKWVARSSRTGHWSLKSLNLKVSILRIGINKERLKPIIKLIESLHKLRKLHGLKINSYRNQFKMYSKMELTRLFRPLIKLIRHRTNWIRINIRRHCRFKIKLHRKVSLRKKFILVKKGSSKTHHTIITHLKQIKRIKALMLISKSNNIANLQN